MQRISVAEALWCGVIYPSHMNRIKELREAAKLTQEELADLVGTTGNTISRLEIGKQELTQEWMERLADTLGCMPADLISNVLLAETKTDDVEPASLDPAVVAAMKKLGVCSYLVTGRSVMEAGVSPGDTITVDERPEAIAKVAGLDIVLLEIGPAKNRKKVLRQFVPPRSFVTNRPRAANLVVNLDDPTVFPKIIGVVIRG